MITPILGILVLGSVIAAALTQRTSGELSFFDAHAATIVFGGVLGSLLIAIDGKSLLRTLKSLRELLPTKYNPEKAFSNTKSQLQSVAQAWRQDRRADVLKLSDATTAQEIRVAADALVGRWSPNMIAEAFTALRTQITSETLPVVESWDLVARLAPSFGMVGTVSGMVQLFQNMGANTGNLGGAMATALVATLYGIAFGAAVGGPMAGRINNHLNERLGIIDLVEKTVMALNSDSKRSN